MSQRAKFTVLIMGFIVPMVGFIVSVILLIDSQPAHNQRQLVFINHPLGSDIAWHPDSERIAIDNIIYNINDPLNNNEYLSISNVSKVLWSPDGNILALTGDQVWLWTQGNLLTLSEYTHYRVYSDGVFNLANDVFVVVSFGLSSIDNSIWIWDTSSYELLDQIAGNNSNYNATGDRGFLNVQDIPYTDLVITASWGDNGNELWNIMQRQREILPYINPSVYEHIYAAPSGQLLAFMDVDQDIIEIVSLAEATSLLVLKSEVNGIDLLKWSYTDNLLIEVDVDTGKMLIRSAVTGHTIATKNMLPAYRLDIDWNPKESLVAITTDKGALVWNPYTGEEQPIHSGSVNKIRWSPDGQKIAILAPEGVYIYQW